MTTEEFSNGFDALVNSYSTSMKFGNESTQIMVFNEYEKSIFLTKAQQELIINLYNGKNIYGDSFELTEEVRRYLDGLVKTVILQPITNQSTYKPATNNQSQFFTLPTDLAFITMEQVTYKEDSDYGCYSGQRADVYPVTQDEFSSVRNNPFRGPTRYKALRLDYGEGKVELISKYDISQYLVKYLSKPTPIVLIDLPDDLSIDGVKVKTECALNDILHQTILDRAVLLAVQSKKLGNINTTTTTTTTTN